MKNSIEQQVMATVAVVYMARRLTSRTALELYALVVSVIGIVAFVSVSNVTANLGNVAQNGIESIVAYIVAAVLGTTIIVQIALVLGVVAFLSLVSDAIKLIASSSTSSRQIAV